MDMTGEYRIPAPRQTVWEALNDPEILKASIPGCEELTKKSDTELEAKVRAKVGPVSARFGGAVTLGDLNPPESYTISGQGSGGAAGFAKGGAKVHLTEDGEVTILRYEATADVGGKLAQIGSRLIQGTARKMADDFFGTFSRIVGERAAAGTAAATTPTIAPEPAREPTPGPQPAPPAEAPEPVFPAPGRQDAEEPIIRPEQMPEQPRAAAPQREDEVASATTVADAAAGQQPGGLNREMERIAPAEPRPAPAPQPAAYTPPPLPAERRGWGQSPLAWLAGVVVFLLLLFWIFS
jgi:carbon monoxide dehydrogenase subunit G